MVLTSRDPAEEQAWDWIKETESLHCKTHGHANSALIPEAVAHLHHEDEKHVLYSDMTKTHEMIYVKRSDFFRREGLYKIRAQFLRLCSDELMKLCLKNCVPPPQKKKNSSRKRKQTRNDLIMITPATPKSRRSSEKQNSFPSATNWAAPVIKILIRRQKAWCLCCGLWGQSYLPGLRQEWLKYNPPHC